MNIDVWLAYAIAASIILVIPGPTIILVISQAVCHGKKSVIPLVAGVVLGDFTDMVLSLLGLGALLSTSASLFTVLKWIGALYLVYLGIQKWRSSSTEHRFDTKIGTPSNLSLFKSAYITTSLNPKGIVFFVAFVPQFLNAGQPAAPQFFIMGATFLILAGINSTLYAIFAGQLRGVMQNPKARKWVDRCGGTALIGAGLATAVTKQG